MRSEKEKMLAGELYECWGEDLVAERKRAKELCWQYNQLGPNQIEARRALLKELLGSGDAPYIEPNFFCDYGYNIHLGKKFYSNHHCVMLDCNTITIGDNVLLAPGVHIYTATHPLDADERRTEREYAYPVVIGNDVWIGGGAIICPGVTIGDRAVIGAGSVVTRDIPAGMFAAGNPCRVVRPADGTPGRKSLE